MKPYRRLYLILFAVILVAIIAGTAATFPFGPDWRNTYRRASHELLSGGNPHELPHPRFLNATWILLPIIPIAALPEKIGGAIFLLVSLVSFAYSAYRLGAKPVAMGVFLASPPVLHCLLNGNIDWIPLLGLTLKPQIGLLLVTAKPQVGSAIALFWLVEAWREGGWREVLRVFAPVTVLFLLTFVLFGFWPQKWTEQPEQWWNASLFPYSVPFGIYLMALAFKRRKVEYALPAGPSFAPYVLFHSWSVAVISVVSSTKWTLIVVGGLWGLMLLRAFVI